jgi:hypothetical protein
VAVQNRSLKLLDFFSNKANLILRIHKELLSVVYMNNEISIPKNFEAF